MVTSIRLLQTPQLLTITNDYAAVSGALNEGRSLRAYRPESRVLTDIDSLARTLLVPKDAEPPKAAVHKGGYLSRLVRALVGL